MDALDLWAQRTRAMRDDEGRPLGELKVADVASGAIELRACPYQGSRHRHERPMNLSALKQASAHWHGILGGLTRLRRLHCAARGEEGLRLADVWRIGNMANALADYAFLRASSPCGDGELPAAVGALYKVTLGVTSTAANMWANGFATLDDFVDVTAFYDFAEREGQLIGHDQVCGGTEAMIKELMSVVIEGPRREYDGAPYARAAGDEARLQSFCDSTAALRLLRIALDWMDGAMRRELAVALGDDPAMLGAPRIDGDLESNGALARFVALAPPRQGAMTADILRQIGDVRFPPGAAIQGLMGELERAWDGRHDASPEAGRDRAAMGSLAFGLGPRGQRSLGRSLAAYREIDGIACRLGRALKRRIAEALGVPLVGPVATERDLAEFRPIRRGRPSMRGALAEVAGVIIGARSET